MRRPNGQPRLDLIVVRLPPDRLDLRAPGHEDDISRLQDQLHAAGFKAGDRVKLVLSHDIEERGRA